MAQVWHKAVSGCDRDGTFEWRIRVAHSSGAFQVATALTSTRGAATHCSNHSDEAMAAHDAGGSAAAAR
eukprot:6419281-Prymnesium_polylepis.1